MTESFTLGIYLYTLAGLKFWKTQSHLSGDKLALEMNRLDLTQKGTLRLGGNARWLGRTVSNRAAVTWDGGHAKGAGKPTPRCQGCMPSGPSLLSLQTLTMLHII